MLEAFRTVACVVIMHCVVDTYAILHYSVLITSVPAAVGYLPATYPA
jgi:hypothetical protein